MAADGRRWPPPLPGRTAHGPFGSMGLGNLGAHSAFVRCAAAWLAGAMLVGTPALAADLPLKASPKAAEFNPFWAEADVLAWSVKGDHLPPLVTASPDGTPLFQAGLLGAP